MEYSQKPGIEEYSRKPGIEEYLTKPAKVEYYRKPGIEEYLSNPGKVEYSQKSGIEEYLPKPGKVEYSSNLENNSQMSQLVDDYKEVFGRGALNPMETEPMVIKLKENYVPKAIMVPRKVPYARRDEEILKNTI